MGMKELFDLHPGHWNLHILPREHVPQLVETCGYLARRGPLLVLDCGRQYDPSLVLRTGMGREEILNRIQSRRAFNCFEASKLLQITQTSKAPIIILDLLSGFYDENVQYHMRQFLLGNCVIHLQRLSKGAGLAVFVQPFPGDTLAEDLFNRLRNAAPQVMTYETSAPQPKQRRMF
jgi:hypothetical protein